jgi:nitric oxide reductase large subunit
MKIKTLLLIIILYTILILYAGLWAELTGRIKFNQWDIIGLGAKGRVTNHNLYSSLYIISIVLIAVILLFKYLISKFIKK